MKRPILIILIGYIIGIIWGLYFKISIVLLYVSLIFIYCIIKKKFKKSKFKLFSIKRYLRYIKIWIKFSLILIIIISSFISNTIIKYQENKYNNLFKGVENIQVEGIIVSNKIEKEYYNRYKLKVQNTYLYINVDPKINLEYGDLVKVEGEFQEPTTSRNYGGFNYKEYLKTLKIYGTIKVEDIDVLNKKQANFILQFSNEIFTKIKTNIEKTYSYNNGAIMLGLLLGYSDNIDEHTQDDFSKSNITHVLSVSGMHILYIIQLLNYSKVLFGKRKSKFIASFLLIIYMFITGLNVSVIRASIMGILMCMSFVFYRKSDIINNIAISALIILIDNPYNIKSISFLLTYAGTIGIIYLNPTIERILKDIRLRHSKYKYTFIQIQRKAKKIIEIISVSISAQLMIVPIIAISFNNFNISFIITNLLLTLIIGAIVIGGFIQVIISFISIKLGIIVAKLIEILVYGLILISKINFGNFIVVTPSLWQVILFYIILISFKIFYTVFHKRFLNSTENRFKNIYALIKYIIKPYIRKIICILVSCTIFFNLISSLKQELEIYFIDVGQGDSTLVITPKGKTILIDGGGSQTYDIGENTLVPYLLDRKIKKIDYMIISHFDYDHVNGLLTVLEKLEVSKIIIGKQGEENEQYKQFKKLVNQKNVTVLNVKKGDVVNIEKDIKFNVLFPTSELIQENVINNNSLVVKLEYKDFKMLFTGDIEEIAEESLLKLYEKEELKADILKVPHHGSKTSSSKKFLEAVSPKLALIGVGENNKFGHPNDEVLNRIHKLRCPNL